MNKYFTTESTEKKNKKEADEEDILIPFFFSVFSVLSVVRWISNELRLP
jgi:hypothetical protein